MNDAPPPTSPERRPALVLRVLKGVILGSLPLLALLALAELALWAVGGGDDGLSLSRGFDPGASYIVPASDKPGWHRTQIWSEKRAELEIPPKGDRARVLMLGGSNTASFPEQLVELELDHREPDPGWEVINLGRPGYGSERVRILFDQALVLEPDVVLVYSGHNEFVERSFHRQLTRHVGGGLKGRLVGLASRLRLFRAVKGALATPGGAPELVRHSADEFVDLPYSETLRYYEAYEANLRHICRTALEAGADVILCTVVGNDLAPPRVSGLPPGTPRDQEVRYAGYMAKAASEIPSRFLEGIDERMDVQDWGMAIGREALAARKAQPVREGEPPPLRAMTGAMADMSATSGPKVESVEGAHWTDPRGWSDEAWRILETMSALHSRELSDAEREAVWRARKHAEKALEIIPEQPDALFLLGIAAYLQGDLEAAREAFAAAGDFDRAPRKGNRITNGIVRRVADDFPEAKLLDMAAMFQANVPEGIVGYEVMVDVCHTQQGVRPWIAHVFAQAILLVTGRAAEADDDTAR